MMISVKSSMIVSVNNSHNLEHLSNNYTGYRVIEDKQQSKFWKVGRVFMMLWTEPAGTPTVPPEGGTRNGSHYSTTYLQGTAYSEIDASLLLERDMEIAY